MKKPLLLVGALCWLCAASSRAEDRYFLGTRTGWAKTKEVFTTGRYKDNRLFLVIGTKPTGRALNTLVHLKSRESFIEYTRDGAEKFTGQLSKTRASISDNASKLGKSFAALGKDPVHALSKPNIVTPAKIIAYLVADSLKIAFYGAKLAIEPVGRMTYGTLALTAGPLVKPAQVLGVGTAIAATGAYGYASSAAGGAVFLGATGAVLGLDVAASPLVGLHECLSRPAQAPAK